MVCQIGRFYVTLGVGLFPLPLGKVIDTFRKDFSQNKIH